MERGVRCEPPEIPLNRWVATETTVAAVVEEATGRPSSQLNSENAKIGGSSSTRHFSSRCVAGFNNFVFCNQVFVMIELNLF